LDFGCGAGEAVLEAMRQGYDAWGVDNFGEGWQHFTDPATANLGGRLRRIAAGEPMSFDDAWFDVIVSNQVFEHVADIAPVASELARVLRPGGKLIAIFPTNEVIIEPHVMAPFVHRLPLRSPAQRMMLLLSKRVGLANSPKTASDNEWIGAATHVLSHMIFYRRAGDVANMFAPWFRLIDRPEPAWLCDRMRRSGLQIIAALLGNNAFEGALRWLCLPLANGVFVLERNHH
jgi:SAM-dependent methyltransferase